jgi:deazaflavin-dependent oxidoreductase (nitroreductase family)
VRRLPPGVQNALTALHCAVVRGSGWRVGGRISSLPVVLLTTRGRRSGKARTVPLMYLDDGGYVLVGSNGGAPGDPGWVLNLRAAPETTMRVAAGQVEVRAEEVADPADYDRLWQRIVAVAPRYATYAGRTDRRIPLVRLQPAGDASRTARAAE